MIGIHQQISQVHDRYHYEHDRHVYLELLVPMEDVQQRQQEGKQEYGHVVGLLVHGRSSFQKMFESD